MTYTERGDKHDNPSYDSAESSHDEASSGSSKLKLPFAPADDDDSPLGSTDQHSDA